MFYELARLIAHRLLMLIAVAAIVAFTLGFAASRLFGFPPARDLPVGINLNGKCQFGDVTQTNRSVTISGSELWSATGFVRGDFLHVTWLDGNSGKAAIGLYKIDDATLTGSWGWAGECAVEDDDLCGEIHPETIVVTRGK